MLAAHGGAAAAGGAQAWASYGARGATAAAAAAGAQGAGGGAGEGVADGARQAARGWQDDAAVVARRSTLPLIRLSVCQALDLQAAQPHPAPGLAQPPPPSAQQRRRQGLPDRGGGAGASVSSEWDGAGGEGEGGTAAVVKAAIVSFRKVELQLGALDLETDQVGRRGVGDWVG